MAEITFRFATHDDIDSVLPFMREFWAFEKLPFDEERNRKLLHVLVSDVSLGRLVLIFSGDVLAGYLVLGFGFSVEFGGRDALLDELYVAPQHRSRGIGTAAINFAERVCRELGIEALHLEADHFNRQAHDLYLRLGFRDHERHLMTRWFNR